MPSIAERREPTFEPVAAVSHGEAEAGAAKGRKARRSARWGVTAAGVAGWSAMACVAVAAAMPVALPRLVDAWVARASAPEADVEITGTIAARPAIGAAIPAGTAPGRVEARPASAEAPAEITYARLLGRGQSADRLWLRWSGLLARNGALLRGTPAAVRPLAADPSTFVLLIGEHRSAYLAEQGCRELRARFIACEVATSDGQPVDEPR